MSGWTGRGARVVAAVVVAGAVGLLGGCGEGSGGSILGWSFGDADPAPAVTAAGEEVGREAGARSTEVVLADGTVAVVLADSPLNDVGDPEQTDRARDVAERLAQRLPADVAATSIEVTISETTSVAGGAIETGSAVRSWTFPRAEL